MAYIGIKHRRDTAANWTASNPILLEGQFGYETDTYTDSGSIRYYKFKLGDGVTAWNSLDYLGFNSAGGGGGSGDVVGPASAVNNRLAAFNGTTGKLIKDGGKTVAEVLSTDNHTDGTTNKVFTAVEKTKLAGIETGAEVNDTASEILVKLLTVDGAGSGLDADLLDGQSSAAFAAALGSDDNYVTDAEKVKLGNLSGTNTGDQTSIVGITGTKSQFDTAVTDGNFMYVGDAPTAHTHPQSEVTNLVTDLAAKAPIASPTFIGTLTTPAIVVSSETASKIAIIDASKNVKSGDTATYPSLTEIAYVKGVTSAIQTQLDGKVAKATVPCEFIVACSDETTALTTGTAKVTFRAPYAFTVTAVRASVTTAATGGTLLTVDINESGTTILSTKLTLDASEKTSTTAATAAVISDSAIADDAEITIDIDAVGSTIAGAGLKVYIIGTHAV